ncbi:NAD(P)-binding domain-containing protein [Arthrobacter sp. UNC362MFTsu5.1]|uniref:NAD(P)-binding domain-containing protein n=1 Tax=Arthrobacter sp. UNC362MFTsu5.1 TaxID=1449044 RepID=UPI003FA4C9A6
MTGSTATPEATPTTLAITPGAASELSVGWVGLGDQGAPMARAIAEAGFELNVWARRWRRSSPSWRRSPRRSPTWAPPGRGRPENSSTTPC